MGRKSLDKERVQGSPLKKEWAEILVPFIEREGTKELNMIKVAAILEKSKATIYKYFQSKEEILELVLNYKLGEIGKFESFLLNPHLPYIERYRKTIEFISGHLLGVGIVVLLDLKKFHPRLWKKIISFQKRTNKAFTQFYQEGIENQDLRPIPISLLLLTDKVFFDSILRPEFLLANGLSLKEAFEAYFNMKCFGMVSESSSSGRIVGR